MAVSEPRANSSAAGLASLSRRATAARAAIMTLLAVQTVLLLLLALGLYSEFSLTFFDFTFWATPMARLLTYLLFAVCTIAVTLWIWRAHANLHAAGLSGLNYSPGWASLSIFVPVANLAVPFLAMRELYNRSHGEPEELAGASVDDANSWWTAWVVAALLNSYLLFAFTLGPVTGIHIVTPPTILSGLILFAAVIEWVAAFFLWRLIGTITAAQKSGTGVGDTFA